MPAEHERKRKNALALAADDAQTLEVTAYYWKGGKCIACADEDYVIGLYRALEEIARFSVIFESANEDISALEEEESADLQEKNRSEAPSEEVAAEQAKTQESEEGLSQQTGSGESEEIADTAPSETPEAEETDTAQTASEAPDTATTEQLHKAAEALHAPTDGVLQEEQSEKAEEESEPVENEKQKKSRKGVFAFLKKKKKDDETTEKTEAEPEEAEVEQGEAAAEEAEVEQVEVEPEETEAEQDEAEPEEAEVEQVEVEPEEAEAEPGEAEPEEPEAEQVEVEPEETEAEQAETAPEEAEVEQAETAPEEAEVEQGEAESEASKPAQVQKPLRIRGKKHKAKYKIKTVRFDLPQLLSAYAASGKKKAHKKEILEALECSPLIVPISAENIEDTSLVYISKQANALCGLKIIPFVMMADKQALLPGEENEALRRGVMVKTVLSKTKTFVPVFADFKAAQQVFGTNEIFGIFTLKNIVSHMSHNDSVKGIMLNPMSLNLKIDKEELGAHEPKK